MARPHLAWLRALLLVGLFALPSRAAPSAAHDYHLALDGATPTLVGGTATLRASVSDLATSTTCVYEGDSGMACSRPTCPSCDCPEWRSMPSGGGFVNATVVSATCDTPGCTASFISGQSTVAVSMNTSGTVGVTVTMRVVDGSVVTGSTQVTFDDPGAIAAVRRVDSIGTMDALLVGQSFTWCAQVTGTQGETLSAAPLFSSTAELSVSATPPCATFRATKVGHATVTEELSGLRREFAVEVVDPSAVTSIAWVDVTSPDLDPRHADVDVDAPLLSTLAALPASGDTVISCGVNLVARFQTTEGRVGLVPRASVTVTGLGRRDKSGDVITLDPRGTSGSGTVSAQLGAAHASVPVTFTDVSSCF